MAIVNVDAAPGMKDTLFVNSYVPPVPNVIVGEEVEVKVIAAAKDQEADVEAFVQAPLTVQVPPAFVMYAPALLMDTFPVTATVEPFVFRMPVAPLTVRPPEVVSA